MRDFIGYDIDEGDTAIAYLTRLAAKYGRIPDLETAKSYLRRNYVFMAPEDIIEVLKVKDWDEVINFWQAYLSGKIKSKKKYYTKDEIITILKEFYQQNGRLPESDELGRPGGSLPSYRTIYSHIGPKEKWLKLIAPS